VTTHLITKKPEGEKYQHAKAWKIKTINDKWIFDSVEAKYCLQEKEYQVDINAETSTPQKARRTINAKQLDIDLSMISNTTVMDRKCIDETAKTSEMSSVNNTTLILNTTTQVSNASKYLEIIGELNKIGKIKSILFDGFNVRHLKLRNKEIFGHLKKSRTNPFTGITGLLTRGFQFRFKQIQMFSGSFQQFGLFSKSHLRSR
jgi:hypothetical protein